MTFSSTDIQALMSAFAIFCAERQLNDGQRLDYLFEVLHRTPTEQDAERRLWIDAERRRVQRLLDSQTERVAEETGSLTKRRDAANALAAKLPPTP